MKRLAGLFVIPVFGLVAAGCGFSDGNPDWAKGVGSAFGASTSGGSGQVDYVHDIKPRIQASCASCHSTLTTNWTLSSGLSDDTADYNATVAQLDTTTPDNSNLLIYASNNGVSHTGGGPWPNTSAEYALVIQWIADGAQLDTGGQAAGGGGGGGGGLIANPVYADIKVHLQSCATTGCHADQTGYRLSLNLSDDAGDYSSTLNVINLGDPAASALLTKATQTAGHPLKVFDVDSTPYTNLLTWISNGAPFN